MGKEKWHKVNFEKSTKNDSIEFRKQKKRKKCNKRTKKTNKLTNKPKTENGKQVLNQQITKI